MAQSTESHAFFRLISSKWYLLAVQYYQLLISSFLKQFVLKCLNAQLNLLHLFTNSRSAVYDENWPAWIDSLMYGNFFQLIFLLFCRIKNWPTEINLPKQKLTVSRFIQSILIVLRFWNHDFRKWQQLLAESDENNKNPALYLFCIHVHDPRWRGRKKRGYSFQANARL